MHLRDEQLHSFSELYTRRFGVVLSPEDVKQKALLLLGLVSHSIKSIK